MCSTATKGRKYSGRQGRAGGLSSFCVQSKESGDCLIKQALSLVFTHRRKIQWSHRSKREKKPLFCPPLNHSSYWRLAVANPIHASSQDMLFHSQYLICSQTNVYKHPDFPQYVARFLVSRPVTHHKVQPTNPFPSHPRFQRFVDAEGRTKHLCSLLIQNRRYRLAHLRSVDLRSIK